MPVSCRVRFVRTSIARHVPGLVPGIVALRLPPEAERPTVYLHDQGGRDQVVTAARYDWSAFERPLPAIFLACVPAHAGLVVDVGANTGFYALLAVAAAGRTRVVAFEPDPAVLPLLRENVALNREERRIAVCAAGVSDRSGTARLYVPTQEHGLVESSSSLEQAFKETHSRVHEVRVTTLDAHLAGWRHRLSRVSIIKIDVEGHEAAVLRGSAATVRRWRPIIFVEVLDRGEMASLTRFVAEHGYVDIPLRPQGPLEPAGSVAFHAEAWNHAFVPLEQEAAFLALAGRALRSEVIAPQGDRSNA